MIDYSIILKPLITEKATDQESKGKYHLLVRKDATKIAIRETFKKLYGVDVKKVNVLRTPAKTRSGRTRVPLLKRREFKKVIVTTKGKKTVDLAKPNIK